MAFCNNCGTQIPEGANNCPQCGAPVAEQQAQQTAQQPNAAQSFANSFTNTTDFTTEYDPQDIQNNKVMAVLAYIGILFLVPLLAAPQSKFARFHTNQGLVLFLAGLAVGIVCSILGLIPFIGFLFAIISGLASVVSLVFMIIGIVNAAQGQAKELPLIGKIKLLK